MEETAAPVWCRAAEIVPGSGEARVLTTEQARSKTPMRDVRKRTRKNKALI
ncbi:hypothetical protein IRT45_12915 [Nocardia sp. BSTN01]|uniref:hypothetical protein n=1 Tax=Nocardia sp. BSTN01 TaxID=2783665 RepID=UPI00188FCCC6|nr:hypothetical protein [Nocardia sp. BSTN01]MBF4998052.1 hypothetical protein [Nocardia sp. BSTN01]